MGDRASNMLTRVIVNIRMAFTDTTSNEFWTQSFIVTAEANFTLCIDVYATSVMEYVVSEVEGTVKFITDFVVGSTDRDASLQLEYNNVLPPC